MKLVCEHMVQLWTALLGVLKADVMPKPTGDMVRYTASGAAAQQAFAAGCSLALGLLGWYICGLPVWSMGRFNVDLP